jgi:ribosomal protein L34E
MEKLYTYISKVYTTVDEEDMTDTFTTLSGSFEKIKKSCGELAVTAMNDFSKFFQYYRYEVGAVEELINTTRVMKQNLIAKEKKLRDKKDSLFVQKQVAKWELDPKCKVPVDTILNNKPIAFKEMLPNETKEMAKQRMYYGYHCNKVLEEFMRINRKDSDEIQAHCLKVAKKNCEVFEDVTVYLPLFRLTLCGLIWLHTLQKLRTKLT